MELVLFYRLSICYQQPLTAHFCARRIEPNRLDAAYMPDGSGVNPRGRSVPRGAVFPAVAREERNECRRQTTKRRWWFRPESNRHPRIMSPPL